MANTKSQYARDCEAALREWETQFIMECRRINRRLYADQIANETPQY